MKISTIKEFTVDETIALSELIEKHLHDVIEDPALHLDETLTHTEWKAERTLHSKCRTLRNFYKDLNNLTEEEMLERFPIEIMWDEYDNE